MGFIKSIKVKNFFSIKNELVLDFKASEYSIENNLDRLFSFKDNYYNKVISIYGANASGKTTILKSLMYISKVITNEQTNYFPTGFKNKFAHKNSKSEIELNFVIKSDKGILTEFIYKIKFLSENHNLIGIDDESLYLISNNKKNKVFSRKEKKIKNVADNIINSVFDKLNSKVSLIEEFYKFDETEYLEQIRFFVSGILGGSNVSVYQTKLGTTSADELLLANILEESSKEFSQGLESFLLGFLNSIGMDITKIKVKFSNENNEESKIVGIDIAHNLDENEFLEFDLESDGTQMLMKILLDIFMIKLSESVLVLDEFDSIIHPMLTPILINLLIENDIQLIYSTHNIYNMKFLQSDELFLIEKDKKHETTINAIKDNPLIKGFENLLSQYENGTLGGVPQIKSLYTKIL